MNPVQKYNNENLKLRVTSSLSISCGESDVGIVRQTNEDSIFLDNNGRFMLLADGMGGQEKGAEASTTAIKIIQNALDEEVIHKTLQDITISCNLPFEVGCMWSVIKDAVQEANFFLFEQNRQLDLARYMGTTIVGFYLTNSGYIIWFHVGDSRLYKYKSSLIERLTTDHSLYEEWVKADRLGIEPKKNILTRALGVEHFVKIEMNYGIYQPNDIYLLCSDGLSNILSDEAIQKIIQKEDDFYEIPSRIVSSAKKSGSRDNISVIVCKTQMGYSDIY
ncbi:MAG: serine/threonine-protein phosphatase [Desulfamplus sp.]|nr:serine/threonine-protein phosphatase [Desulfamplus sp.]